MRLSFTETQLAGGVKISGDISTLKCIESLLVSQAKESPICDATGLCMRLSAYFRKQNTQPVDWITLITSISLLRKSMGYDLTTQEHAHIYMLEHLLLESLHKSLGVYKSALKSVLDIVSCSVSDHIRQKVIDPRVAYLYFLQTPTARRAELLQIIKSINPMFILGANDGYNDRFKDIPLSILEFNAGEQFQYEL